MRRILQLDIVLFALGFVVGVALAVPSLIVASVGGAAALCHRIAYGRITSVAALGFFTACVATAARPVAAPFFTTPVDVEVVAALLDGPRRHSDGFAYEAELRTIDGEPTRRVRVRLFTVAPRGQLAGDVVRVFARCAAFTPAELAGDRGARARWAARGISARCTAREPLEPVGSTSVVRRTLAERRMVIEERLLRLLGRRAGVPTAMLTGTRGLVTHSERRAHQRAGTAHLLAISGVHFGALAGIVWFFALLFMRRIPAVTRRVGARRGSAGLVLVAMLGYLLFVGAPISAVRASVAVSALVVGLLIGRRASGIAAVSIAAVALLAVSPALLWDLGFQLSFAATLAIVLFWQRLPTWLEHDPYRFEPVTLKRRVFEGAVRFVLMSWVATAATAPILTAALGEFSLAAFLTNLIAVPVVSAFVFPALLTGVAGSEVAPQLGEPIIELATEVMLRLTLFVEDVADAPGAVWTVGTAPGWWALALVVCVFVAVSDRLRWRTVILASLSAATVSAIAYWPRPPGWRLHFIPVGQGDATLIEAPTGERVLVDAGGSAFGRDPGLAVVGPYLRRVGVTRLDALILTHADIDHAGGVPAVLQHIDVARLVTEPAELEIPGVSLSRWVETGSRNDRSIVVKVDAAGAVVVLPGDVEVAAERAWQPHRIHVLKVAHHGSKSSTTADFVEQARPLVAVVSAGRHNRFGHPHPAVVGRLRSFGASVHSTSDHGLVLVEISLDGEIRSRTRRID